MVAQEKEYINDYTEDKQHLLICILLSSDDIFARCQNILEAKYFVAKLRPAVKFILKYSNEFRVLPKIEHVNAETGLKFEKVEGILIQHQESFLKEIEGFCKNRAIAEAVLNAPALIEKGNYGEVENQVREAILISLQSDLGTDYFDDPRSRLMKIKDRNGQTSTGWKTVDDKLYGGINRGEITLLCGGSGSGKSIFLQNLALNFCKQNLNVVYITLELSEGLTSMRMDSMLTDIGTRDIFRNLDSVEIKVKQAGFKSGLLHIKQLPQGSTCNDIRAYLKNYEIDTQKRPDVLIVDYLDLVFPNNVKIDPSNLFVKDKFVTEEMRGLAVERNMFTISASQLGRGSVNEQEHDHSMIAGGISKINTADNVLSIYVTAAMKERGQYQLQFLKTRSSSGVGSKVTIGFDPNTLRIFDLDDDAMELANNGALNAQKTIDDIRRKSSITTQPEKTIPESSEKKTNNLATLINLTKRR